MAIWELLEHKEGAGESPIPNYVLASAGKRILLGGNWLWRPSSVSSHQSPAPTARAALSSSPSGEESRPHQLFLEPEELGAPPLASARHVPLPWWHFLQAALEVGAEWLCARVGAGTGAWGRGIPC